MIMPETHRENRHRRDTAQRKSCQTVQKADINNNSLPDLAGPEICESEITGISSVASILGISASCVAMRRPELERSWNKDALALPQPRGTARIDVWTVSI